MTENEFTYWAFLSYSQQDNAEQCPDAPAAGSLCWGDWLHAALKTFSVPAEFAGHINARAEIIPDRIDPMFQDQEEQAGNGSLSGHVRQALEQSKCLIVICSPRSAQSLHVNEVVRYFKQLGRGHRILSIVVAGEPNASDGNKPGILPAAECFVPALRHPLKPDGTLDTTRPERGYIFADARQGADKRELLATDHPTGEVELATAKIQLIAGLLGVGFNGLWGHELKRRLAEAQIQVREAQRQLAAARNEVREAQNKVLSIQNLSPDVHSQIQEAQNQAREAQSQLAEARTQVREAQNQLQAIQNQVEDARHQTRAAESKALVAQQLAREAQSQLEAARIEIRETQHQVLASQNQPPDVQSQLEEARIQAREAQNKVLEAQAQSRAAQSQVQEFQDQVREALGQVAEARTQAQAAESRVLAVQEQAQETQRLLDAARNEVREAHENVLASQNLPPDVHNQIQAAQDQARADQTQLEAARNQAREAQNQVQELQSQAQAAHSQLEEARNQTLLSESKVQEAQQLAQETQRQLEAVRNEVRAAKNQVLASQEQAGAAQNQVQEFQNQVRQARSQVAEAHSQVQETDRKAQAARRLTKVFAILAVLALLAAGLARRQQHQLASQAPAKATAVATTEPDLAAAPLNREQIQQALQRLGGTGPDENQMRRWDALAARIPTEEIPETLKASADILDDPQRSHFQAQLLDCWMKTNLPAAFDWSCQLTNVADRQRTLEKIIPALAADTLTNTLARLNDLKPAVGEQSYTQLFQHWAAQDPIQAIEQRQQIPGQDADAKILSAIMAIWVDQQPAAALNWLASQPDSEALPVGTRRNTMIADLFDRWAVKDLDAATTACQQLPDSTAKEMAWEQVLSQMIAKAPAAAAEAVKNLSLGDYRQKAIVELCNHWVGTNAPAVLDWAQSLPAEAERVAVTNRVVVNWAQNDPQSAAQFAGQHPELSGTVLGEIANAWFQRDFTATTNWVASLLEGEQQDAARLALVEAWAQNDPKGMAAYALSLPAGAVQTRYLTAASRQLARRDLPGTVELLQPLSDAGLRQTILESAVRHGDLAHLNQAAKFIAAMPAGDDQKAAIKGLVSSWAPADPESAVNWLVSFPETNSQPELVLSVLKIWAQPEPSMVAKWLANQPLGTASEGMVSAFLEGAATKYPEYAAQWTQSVTDETQRQKYQIQVARQWLKTDATAATKWFDSLSLPEEIKQSLKAPLPNPVP